MIDPGAGVWHKNHGLTLFGLSSSPLIQAPVDRTLPMSHIIWLLAALASPVFGAIVDSLSDDLLNLEYDFIIVGGGLFPVSLAVMSC
jgi:hypothetical protein